MNNSCSSFNLYSSLFQGEFDGQVGLRDEFLLKKFLFSFLAIVSLMWTSLNKCRKFRKCIM